PGDDAVEYRPAILIRYEVNDRPIEKWTYDINRAYSSDRDSAVVAIEQFEVGQRYFCWYDPETPETVVVVRGYSWWMWLLLVLPASFFVIGSVGLTWVLLQSSTSAERRASLAQKASQLDLFEDAAHRGVNYPTIPRADDVTASPGTRLAYRLPIDASPGWNLFGTLLACLFWNGVVAAGWIGVVAGLRTGDGSLYLALFLVPFSLVGLGLIRYFVRQLIIIKGIGGTRIEISAHPLYPGSLYEVFLSQEGRQKMKSLEMFFTCREQATYRQGTDTRTATECVYEESVYHRKAFEVRPGIPFEDRCEIQVPADAMHSFKSDHNEIGWSLLVRGKVVGWPDFERRFPIVVYPAAEQPAVMESSQA
ncbi:MAG: hypothetical protein V3V75_11025, partial [Thermoguttaceae bacterium]